jgi:site-specific DNA-methyltransferase (adenine-specific)
MNQCMIGDSTQRSTWEKALGSRLGDALITDPPYCILTRRKKSGELRDKKDVKIERGPLRRFDSVREYREFTKSWLSLAVQFLKPEAPLVIWTNLLGRAPIQEVCTGLGYAYCLGEFIWAKRTREGNSGEELLRMVETALVFSRNPIPKIEAESPAIPWAVVAGYDDDKQAEKHGNHPNHKPFGVLEPLIRTWSLPTDLVVDCFAGSGSIPAAALKLQRKTACIEMEVEWAARVSARLHET